MKNNTSLILSAILCGGLTVSATAATISINITDVGAELGGSDVTGVEAVGNWNNVTGLSTSNLNDDTATPTTLDIDLSTSGGSQFNSWGTGDPAQTLLRGGYGDQSTQGATVTIDLAEVPYATYDLSVYLGQAPWMSDRFIDTSDGSTTFYSELAAPGAPFVQSTAILSGDRDLGNYVLFSGLTGASQSITAVFDRADDASDLQAWGSAVSGLQIVQVPEPSTYALMAGSLALVIVTLRRRNR